MEDPATILNQPHSLPPEIVTAALRLIVQSQKLVTAILETMLEDQSTKNKLLSCSK